MEAHMGSEDTVKVSIFTWLLAREAVLTQETCAGDGLLFVLNAIFVVKQLGAIFSSNAG